MWTNARPLRHNMRGTTPRSTTQLPLLNQHLDFDFHFGQQQCLDTDTDPVTTRDTMDILLHKGLHPELTKVDITMDLHRDLLQGRMVKGTDLPQALLPVSIIHLEV